MSLQEQRDTLERMLGERMLVHADTVLRQWAKELGVDSYFDRLHSLGESYHNTFEYYLTGKNEDREDILNEITYRYYQLTDELYAEMRLLRGESPRMYGFGPDNRDSVCNYFAQCLTLSDHDLDWLYTVSQDPERQGLAICAVAALAANIRNAYNEKAVFALVDISELDTPVADQAIAQLILVVAHFDLRIDFFVELQDRIIALVDRKRENAYFTLGALIRSVKKIDINELDEDAIDSLPDELYDALDATQENMVERMNEEMSRIEPYMRDMAQVLPDTWIFNLICDTDERREKIARVYVNCGMQNIAFDGCLMGRMDIVQDAELKADMLLYNELADEALELYLDVEQQLLHMRADEQRIGRTQFRIAWCAMISGDYDLAEKYMLVRLRGKHITVDDYINYGHLCWIRGDRLTAYENYREARRLSRSIKRFKESWCPDRKLLTQMGIPLDEVYLMEDNLVKLKN